MTPRQTVRDYFLTGLLDIQRKNQYALDVVTVELQQRLIRDLNISDCPAIIVELGIDNPLGETQGANRANSHFREWAMKLWLVMPDPGQLEIEDAGEVFIGAVMRWLIRNRFNNGSGGKPSDIQFTSTLNAFQRIENGTAESVLDIKVLYDFTVGEL